MKKGCQTKMFELPGFENLERNNEQKQVMRAPRPFQEGEAVGRGQELQKSIFLLVLIGNQWPNLLVATTYHAI